MPAQGAFDVTPQVQPIDGIPYATLLAIPAVEGALFNQPAQRPALIAVTYHEAIAAIVELATQGAIVSQTTYIVMQTDFGDGVWVDVAWCAWTGLTSATFVLSGGVAGADSFQQTRAAGTAPSPAQGSNQIPLGGRIRFVGKSSVTASAASSVSSGSVTPAVLATIRYKLLGLR